MDNLILTLLALPLLGFLFSGLFGKHLPKNLVGGVGTLVIFASFCIALYIFTGFNADSNPEIVTLYKWFSLGGIPIDFAFQIDQLSLMMALIVTGIASLIHLYSIGYMHDDATFHRFFSFLNLFVFSMLILVLANNFVLLYFGWEGVAVCSYLLIGYWYQNEEYSAAGRKSFIMNRIGDLGLFIGIFVIALTTGYVDFLHVAENASSFQFNGAAITLVTVSLFIGATGKSAQIPLYTWLPDAMAGPTPVSALIHAATMVTAGIYLVVRSNFLFSMAPWSMDFILYIGLITSLVAGFIAMRQNDIKKVLAYSTVSQLGFMFVAVGSGAYVIAMFHLMTHAFFKALLFLGSGSVIHAMGGEQDMRFMGNLRKKIPVTYWTFLIATFAIAGFPFFSGMISKDEILAATFSKSPVLWLMLFISAALTALYMFRLIYLTFFGSYRGAEVQAEEKVHESPLNMTLPLVILAILSVFGGVFNLPHYLAGDKANALQAWLDKTIITPVEVAELNLNTELILLTITTLMFFGVWWYVKNTYVNKGKLALPMEDYKGWEGFSAQKMKIDDFYNMFFVGGAEKIGKGLRLFDRNIVDTFFEFIGMGAEDSGEAFKRVQNGNVETYLLAMSIVAGIILIINFILI